MQLLIGHGQVPTIMPEASIYLNNLGLTRIHVQGMIFLQTYNRPPLVLKFSRRALFVVDDYLGIFP